MKLFPEIHIDTKDAKVIFPVPTAPLSDTGRNLLLTNCNKPVLKAYSGADRLLFFLDTGNNKDDLFYIYYEKYKDKIDSESTKESVTGGGFGFIRTKEVLSMPSVEFNVGETAVKMNNIYVHLAAGTDQTHEDSNLGMDLIKLFDTTILNFKDMFVMLE